jgi:hypothetical protein
MISKFKNNQNIPSIVFLKDKKYTVALFLNIVSDINFIEIEVIRLCSD